MPYFISYVHAKFQKLMTFFAKDSQIVGAASKFQDSITFDPSTQLKKKKSFTKEWLHIRGSHSPSENAIFSIASCDLTSAVSEIANIKGQGRALLLL